MVEAIVKVSILYIYRNIAKHLIFALLAIRGRPYSFHFLCVALGQLITFTVAETARVWKQTETSAFPPH